ncbi:MAG: hypothetical protein V4594_16800 [Bacteroidota bacterium]
MAKTKTGDAPASALNLVSQHVKVIPALATNEFAQNFITGEGEVVIRFKNFTKKPRYFLYNVTEVDVDGKPLTEPVVENKGSGALVD